MSCPNMVRDFGGGFADQFQIAQGGVIDQFVRYETGLIEPAGLG